MSVVVVAVVAISVVLTAVVTAFIAISVSTPRSITLQLNSQHTDVVMIEIGKWLPNGQFDFGRIKPKFIEFEGVSQDVTFNGLEPGQWYQITLASPLCGSNLMLKTGSFIEYKLHDKCSEEQIAEGVAQKTTMAEFRKRMQ
jgi:hypothetical protein